MYRERERELKKERKKERKKEEKKEAINLLEINVSSKREHTYLQWGTR
jgi:hypothetical protein